jgi:crossover junction endodeoxyribonuclease RuvC
VSHRVLGIDPGLQKTGWGLLLCDGPSPRFLASGRIQTKATLPLEQRLAGLLKELHAVFEAEKPDVVALERTFVNKNAASSLKLSLARGVCFAVPGTFNIAVHEYSPNLIKSKLLGYGHAPKAQIQHYIQSQFQLTSDISEDEADALAIALVHIFSR